MALVWHNGRRGGCQFKEIRYDSLCKLKPWFINFHHVDALAALQSQLDYRLHASKRLQFISLFQGVSEWFNSRFLFHSLPSPPYSIMWSANMGQTVDLRSNSTQFDCVSVYQLLKLLNYSGASVYLVVSPLSTDRGRIHDKFSSIRFWWSTFCCLWVMFAAKIVSWRMNKQWCTSNKTLSYYMMIGWITSTVSLWEHDIMLVWQVQMP